MASINVNADDIQPRTTPEIILQDNTSCPVDLIDEDRKEGKVIIYTRNYGEFTDPFDADTFELVVVNNIIASKNTNGATGTYIPTNGYVLSYTGPDKNLADILVVGDSLTLSGIDMPVSPDMYFRLDDIIVPIDQINSIRNANQTVLYKPSHGETTKTNPWGIELTAINGIITHIADMIGEEGKAPENNSYIPENGMVISLHSGSSYYKQVQEKAKVGDNIAIFDDSLKLYSAAKVSFAAMNPMTIEDNPAAWDAAEGKPYDSFRGPNQLIIYDSSYGESTGTNPYGYEVAVSSEGRVISTGGNDLKIPEGGYVLSGHGDKLNWLSNNALLGSSVSLSPDRKEVVVILTPDSYISRASFSIEAAKERLDFAKLNYLDVDYEKIQSMIDMAEARLKDIQARTESGAFEDLVKSVKEMQKAADEIYFMTFESPLVENRAIWLRPKETGIEGVRKKLDMLKELNINTIYLEAYFNGYSIYPSENEFMVQNPIFKGFDVLDAYIKEAHSRGIELHAWVENFLVGPPIAEKKPEWMAVSKKGDLYYLENGKTKYYFLNPALPDVRDFLSGLYKELVKKYPIDGIQFDYMRYSHSGDYTNDFSYDMYTRQLFKAYTGTDPASLDVQDELWEKWCEFRAHIISSYAYRVISEIRSINPNIHISADVWPEYAKTIADIYQDPKAWTRKDYIDTLIPMSYYLHEGPVVDDLINTWAFSRGHSQITSGIATFTRVDKKVLIRQIDAVRSANTNGIAIFEFDSLYGSSYDEALKLGVFSKPSMVTGRNPEQAIRAVLDDIIRKIDDIYIPCKAMDHRQGENYKKLFAGIPAELTGDKAETAVKLKYTIQDILKTIYEDQDLKKEAAHRISADLNTVINILDAKTSNLRFMSGHTVSEFQIELPFNAAIAGSAVPIKVRAVFDDSSIMYLDKSQYRIKSGNPAAVETEASVLRIKNKDKSAVITVDILDNFLLSSENDLNRKVQFLIDKTMHDAMNSSESFDLKATGQGYRKVLLDWGRKLVDSDISGYIVCRDDDEIARVSSTSYYDRDLSPDTVYNYQIHGFDSSGNIVYKSNQLIFNTKGPMLITDR